jgi:hypothetical protein
MTAPRDPSALKPHSARRWLPSPNAEPKPPRRPNHPSEDPPLDDPSECARNLSVLIRPSSDGSTASNSIGGLGTSGLGVRVGLMAPPQSSEFAAVRLRARPVLRRSVNRNESFFARTSAPQALVAAACVNLATLYPTLLGRSSKCFISPAGPSQVRVVASTLPPFFARGVG